MQNKNINTTSAKKINISNFIKGIINNTDRVDKNSTNGFKY